MDRWDAKHWEKTRQRGRTSFVWRHGVLAFGMTVLLVMTVWTPLIERMMGEQPQPHRWPWIVRFLIAVPLYVCLGYFWGRVVWWQRERDYLATLAKANKSVEP